MKRVASILLLAVMGMLAISACASQPLNQGGSPTPEATLAVTTAPSETTVATEPLAATAAPSETTVATEPPAATPAAGDQKIVTLDDQGKTINLAVGEGFLLKLGETYTWDITISDQTVLSRVKNIAVVRGAQGIYDAHQPGTVTLSATGDPLCRQSKPACGMPSMLFAVTIVVK